MVIDFHYDTGNIRRLGCRRLQLPMYDTSCFFIDGAQGEAIETIEVDLDTRLIDKGNTKSFLDHGRLRSFKVSSHKQDLDLLLQAVVGLYLPRIGISQIYTNRGRKKHFRPEERSPERSYSLKSMAIVPGTTLTGLYAGWVTEIQPNEQCNELIWRWQDHYYGLVSLGLISEFVRETAR